MPTLPASATNNLYVLTFIVGLGSFVGIAKKYIKIIFDLAKSSPQKLSYSFLVSAWYLAYNLLSFSSQTAQDPPSDQEAAAYTQLILSRIALLYGSITLFFGPLLLFPPLRPVKINQSALMDYLSQDHAPVKVGFFGYLKRITFFILLVAQGVTIYGLYYILAESGQVIPVGDPTLAIALLIVYALIAIFYMVVFFSVLFDKPLIIKGIDILNLLRRNFKVKNFRAEEEDAPPIKPLIQKWYPPLYAIISFIIFCLTVGLVIWVLSADFTRLSKFPLIALVCFWLFVVISFIAVFSLTAGVVMAFFRPIPLVDATSSMVETGDSSGLAKLVPINKVKMVTLASSANRSILFELINSTNIPSKNKAKKNSVADATVSLIKTQTPLPLKPPFPVLGDVDIDSVKNMVHSTLLNAPTENGYSAVYTFTDYSKNIEKQIEADNKALETLKTKSADSSSIKVKHVLKKGKHVPWKITQWNDPKVMYFLATGSAYPDELSMLFIAKLQKFVSAKYYQSIDNAFSSAWNDWSTISPFVQALFDRFSQNTIQEQKTLMREASSWSTQSLRADFFSTKAKIEKYFSQDLTPLLQAEAASVGSGASAEPTPLPLLVDASSENASIVNILYSSRSSGAEEAEFARIVEVESNSHKNKKTETKKPKKGGSLGGDLESIMEEDDGTKKPSSEGGSDTDELPTDDIEAEAASSTKKKRGLFGLFKKKTPEPEPTPLELEVEPQLIPLTTSSEIVFMGPRLETLVDPEIPELSQLFNPPTSESLRHSLPGSASARPATVNSLDSHSLFKQLNARLYSASEFSRMNLCKHISNLKVGPTGFERYSKPKPPPNTLSIKRNGLSVTWPFTPVQISCELEPLKILPMTAAFLYKNEQRSSTSSARADKTVAGVPVHPRIGINSSLSLNYGTSLDSYSFESKPLFTMPIQTINSNFINENVPQLQYQNINGLNVITQPTGVTTDTSSILTAKTIGTFNLNTPFYFEMTILNSGRDGAIGIGLVPQGVSNTGMPGWNSATMGYHGDDGKRFGPNTGGQGKPFGPVYTAGDTVGLGFDPHRRSLFFTKNGKFLGYGFASVNFNHSQYHAAIGLHTEDAMVTTNFDGKTTPFKWNPYVEVGLAFSNGMVSTPLHWSISVLDTPEETPEFSSTNRCAIGFSAFDFQDSGEFYALPGDLVYSVGFDLLAGSFKYGGGHELPSSSIPIAPRLKTGDVLDVFVNPSNNFFLFKLNSVVLHAVTLDKLRLTNWTPLVGFTGKGWNLKSSFNDWRTPAPTPWLGSSSRLRALELNNDLLSELNEDQLQVRSGLDFTFDSNEAPEFLSQIDVTLAHLSAFGISSLPSADILNLGRLTDLAEKAKKPKGADDDEEEEEEDDDDEAPDFSSEMTAGKWLKHPSIDPDFAFNQTNDPKKQELYKGIDIAYNTLRYYAAQPLFYDIILKKGESAVLTIGPGIILAQGVLQLTNTLLSNLSSLEFNPELDAFLSEGATIISKLFSSLLPVATTLVDGQYPSLECNQQAQLFISSIMSISRHRLYKALTNKCPDAIQLIPPSVRFFAPLARIEDSIIGKVDSYPYPQQNGNFNPDKHFFEPNMTARLDKLKSLYNTPTSGFTRPTGEDAKAKAAAASKSKSTEPDVENTGDDPKNAIWNREGATSLNLSAAEAYQVLLSAINSWSWLFSSSFSVGQAQISSTAGSFPIPYSSTPQFNSATGVTHKVRAITSNLNFKPNKNLDFEFRSGWNPAPEGFQTSPCLSQTADLFRDYFGNLSKVISCSLRFVDKKSGFDLKKAASNVQEALSAESVEAFQLSDSNEVSLVVSSSSS